MKVKRFAPDAPRKVQQILAARKPEYCPFERVAMAVGGLWKRHLTFDKDTLRPVERGANVGEWEYVYWEDRTPFPEVLQGRKEFIPISGTPEGGGVFLKKNTVNAIDLL